MRSTVRILAQGRRAWPALGLALALALGGAGAQAQDEQPTPTPEAAQEATPVAAPDAAVFGAPNRTFDFEGATDWPVGDYDFAKAELVNGRYQLTSTGITGIVFSGTMNLGDFATQVEVYPKVCPGNSAFGVTFRMGTNPVSDYYYVYVRCNATFTAGLVSGGSVDTRLQGALSAPLRVEPEGNIEPHKLGIQAKGSTFDLFWDGALLGSFIGAERASGELGLSVSPSSDGQEITVAFDNLNVWGQNVSAAAATPTATPAVTGTPIAAAPTGPGVPVPDQKLFAFTFTEANEWFVGEDAFVRAALTDERYVMTPLSGTAALFSNMVDVDDAYIKVDVYPQTCPENAIVGFAFRQQQPGSYYVFGVRCDGAWLVQKLPPDVPPFITGQLSAPLRTASDEPHTVEIMAVGAEVTITWDGVEVGSFEDSTFSHGDVGFHLQGGTGDEEFTVAFDNLEVWSVAVSAPVPAATEAAGTPAPTPVTAAAAVPPIPVGAIRYETEFDEAGSWFTGAADFVDARIENGRYILTSTNIVGTFYSAFLNLSDYYAQYEVTPIACPGAAAFGLPFRVNRASPGAFYVAIMQCDGNWRLSRVTTDEAGNVQGEVLVSGSLGAPLTTGESHTIGVSARGPSLVYYWDGAELGRASDSTHTSGDIGFQVRPVFPTYEPITISVDYFRVWYLP